MFDGDLRSETVCIPFGLDLAARRVGFYDGPRAEVARAVFLDDTWDRSRMEARAMSFEAFLEDGEPPTARPSMIWHTAFCCSTLLADCLDVPGTCLALKEPKILVDAALQYLGQPKGADPRLARRTAAWLGRAGPGGERVVVKPSNGANTLLPVLDEEAAGPSLLLYSSCEAFVCSVVAGGPVAGGGELRRSFARTLVANRVLSRSGALPWRPEDILRLSDLQVAALLWHVQVAEFREAASRRPDRFRSLDAAAFLADPGGALTALDRFFGLGLPAGEVGRILAGPKLRRSAKAPGQAFSPSERAATLREARAQLGAGLADIVRWSYAAFPATPPGDPVGSPLLS